MHRARQFRQPGLRTEYTVANNNRTTIGQDWAHENNYVFAPVTELPRVAQLLHERPTVTATLVVPHWPAQAWFQVLASIADHVETRPLSEVARPAAWLPSSARTALSGAMLSFVRVAGLQGGRSSGE